MQTTQTEKQTKPVSISLEHTPTAKALKLIELGKIRKTEAGYLAVGSRGLTWEITNGGCECEGYRYRTYCYHSIAAKLIEKGVLQEVLTK